MEHLFFGDRREVLTDTEQSDDKAQEQHAGGDEKDRAQAVIIRQQSSGQWPQQGATYATGGERPKRPAALMARNLRGNQGIRIGNKSAQ